MMSFNSAAGWRPQLMLMTVLLVMAITQACVAQRRSTSTGSKVKMQGDSFTTSTFAFWNPCWGVDGQIEFPVLGRTQIAENNSAMPQDRIYFTYRGFANALNATIGDGAGTTLGNRDLSASRYTFGIEKTFLDGAGSVEIRMPLVGTIDNFFDQGAANESGGVGNLTLIPKLLLAASDTAALAIGLGISVPTGEDARVTLDDEIFTIRNEAAYLAPFLAYLAVPNDRSILQGFLTLNIPLGGNSVHVRDTAIGGPPTDLGSVQDPTLLYIDVSAAYWLYWNPDSRGITGIAPAVELHYTTFLNSDTFLDGGDTFHAYTACTEISVGTPQDTDVVNLTFGVHATLGSRTTVYCGTAVPLSGDRFFDSEIQATVNVGF